MRIIPTKEKPIPKQIDGKSTIVEWLKNSATSRHRIIKKQPRIKPRYGIFGSSAWARVSRNQLPPPNNVISQSQRMATAIKERVQARIDDNLDFLLENQSEKQSRPAESYINLVKRKAETHTLTQQTEHNHAESNGTALTGQNSVFGGNLFPISPIVIDITTPVVKNDPLPTPFSEYNGTINSMDPKVANVFDKPPPAVFDTPSESIAFDAPFDDNIAEFDGYTFDVSDFNGRECDDYIDIKSNENSPVDLLSGWSNGQWNADDFSVSTEPPLKTRDTSSNRYENVWMPNVNHSTPRQQPLSERLAERIRSRIVDKMLEVIRRLNKCHFSPVCDDSDDASCNRFGTEWQSDYKQTVAGNWSGTVSSAPAHRAFSVVQSEIPASVFSERPITSHANNSFRSQCNVEQYRPDDEFFWRRPDDRTELWRSDSQQTDFENWPVVTFPSAQKTANSSHSANRASMTTMQQVCNNAFFQQNHVTIVQTSTTSRIFKSAAANAFPEEFNFNPTDGDEY